jgi:hypothetical protein
MANLRRICPQFPIGFVNQHDHRSTFSDMWSGCLLNIQNLHFRVSLRSKSNASRYSVTSWHHDIVLRLSTLCHFLDTLEQNPAETEEVRPLRSQWGVAN